VSAAPVVTVQNLVKKYGHLVAADDVSLSKHEGEIFGIIGPNGAATCCAVSPWLQS
jgi:ABC-type branched-subunit amino acid transport system ATPase component